MQERHRRRDSDRDKDRQAKPRIQHRTKQDRREGDRLENQREREKAGGNPPSLAGQREGRK